MRLFGILALLLALASVAHAQNLTGAITPYLLPGETYLLDNFGAGGGNYTLVTVGGKPYFLLELAGGEYAQVENVSLVQSLLVQKKLATMEMDARISNISAHLMNFNASRGKERLCRQYTGLIIVHEGGAPDEERACLFNSTSPEAVKLCLNGSQDLPHATCAPPIESCLVACRTVPICFTALANNLPGIYEIFYFKRAIGEMDSNVSALLAKLPEVQALDPAAVNESQRLLANIGSARNGADSNGLFTKYSFCEDVAYNVTALDSAGAILDGIGADVDYINGLGKVAMDIVGTTLERKRLAGKGAGYEVLLQNATQRMNEERRVMSGALAVLTDPFTKNTHDAAEYAFYKFTSAVAAKDYIAADIAYQDFTVAAENAENAAQSLAQRYGKLHGLVDNCTQSVYRAEQLDTDQKQLGSTTRLLAQFSDYEARLNATPIAITDFAVLENSVKGTCVEVGGLLGTLNSDFFEGKKGKVEQNLMEARNVSQSYGEELNDSAVREILALANASLFIGNFDRADELYTQALDASAALLAAVNGKGQNVSEAEKRIAEVEGRINDSQTSWKFFFVRPETGIASKTAAAARAALHSDPAKALELADDASAEMDAATSAVEMVNYGIVAGALMLILAVGILAVALVFVKRMRSGKYR